MGVRVTTTEKKSALFDSVTEWAFGPTFDSEEDAESFLEWYDATGRPDLRSLKEREINLSVAQWRETRDEVSSS